ncbi:hypothetical protein GLP31_19600 [Photobacterium carnosum]|uniref:hypothetical protein n=1 Tax=Photobacterium carnosum TaxID=2023717 RepID=UPI001E4D978F|nr:hypothetical protein [Photobacterium carnosum]MCD9554674.1 hypothetical protein [Photobacterium carnosum]
MSKTNNGYSYNYNDMVCDDSKHAVAKEINSQNYARNMNSYYKQDSSDFKAIANKNKSKEELDRKYAKYSNKI